MRTLALKSTWTRSGLVALAAVTTAGLAAAVVAAVPSSPISPTPAPDAAPVAAAGAEVNAQAEVKAQPVVKTRIVALNDFHGHLESKGLSISAKTATSTGPGHVKAGGAAYLSAKVKSLKRQNPNTVVVSAGDMIGASPMISGYFHDEPTIAAMNHIVDVGTVGNHEFDEGSAELRRLATKMDFDLLAANVVVRRTGQPMFAPTVTRTVGGAKIGFIGVTTIDTPHLLIPEGVKDITFLDPVETIKKYAPQLRAQGADAIVVIAHEGAAPNNGKAGKTAGINDCKDVQGPIVEITKAVAPQVDAVISGHTHKAYNCRVDGTVLTEAATYGRLVTRLDLTIDTAAHKVTASSARNIVVDHKGRQDPLVKKIVARYAKKIAPAAHKVVGRMARTADRNPTRSGESHLGDLIADAQLEATKKAGAQFAIVQRGVLRGSLYKGRVTAEDVFTAQPFGVRLTTRTFTGKQLDTALEQQFCNDSATTNDRMVPLNVSRTFSYRYDQALPCGKRIRMADTKLNGKAITAAGKYRVTFNAFMGSGGDGMPAFAVGTRRTLGVTDQAALTAYLKKHSPVKVHRRTRVMPL